MNASIRKAGTEDLKTIQDLNHKLFVKEQAEYDERFVVSWPYSDEGVAFFNRCITGEQAVALVAEVDSQIVGYLCATLSKSPSHRERASKAELQNMFVKEGYRGQGVGHLLVQAFEAWAKELNVDLLSVTASAGNTETLEFYRAQGFSNYEIRLEKGL